MSRTTFATGMTTEEEDEVLTSECGTTGGGGSVRYGGKAGEGVDGWEERRWSGVAGERMEEGRVRV